MNNRIISGEREAPNGSAFTAAQLDKLDEGTWPALLHLEEQFLAEIGEGSRTAAQFERLREAAAAGRIAFFLAWQGGEAVGMCSVSRCFSTFTCSDVGVFDDFFVERAFRGRGVARLLAECAQAYCREQGLGSLSVGCCPGDVGMYRALGFSEELGHMLAHIP